MKHRLLIVEDHPLMRQSYEMLFGSTPDLEVCGAVPSAELALEQLQKTAPDLVLVDISLPGMNGISLAQHLRARNPSLGIVVTSGHDQRTYVEMALKAGANRFVSKENSPGVLLNAIREVLREK